MPCNNTTTINVLHMLLINFSCPLFGLLHFFHRTLRTEFKTQKLPPELFCNKGVLRNLVKFTAKHLWQSLFFNKVASACNFIKKETLAQVFYCEFCEISKNNFFTEHLWTTASVTCTKMGSW